MPNALFAFNHREAARAAAQSLVAAGAAPAAVRLHVGLPGSGESLPVAADEQVTGGLVTNLLQLFQGVFDWGDSPHDASAFEEALRQGGAVVGVDAGSDDDQARADRVMAEAGCTQRTPWCSQGPMA